MNDLELRVAALEARVAVLEKNRATPVQGEVASDEDLDGKYGDAPIKYDPKEKYWSGPSYVGRRPSECPADYLDAQAKYLSACAFMANKNGEEKKAGYKTKDAARYRGWAVRIRNGWAAKNGQGGGAQTELDAHGYSSSEGEYEAQASQFDDSMPF